MDSLTHIMEHARYRRLLRGNIMLSQSSHSKLLPVVEAAIKAVSLSTLDM